MTHLESGVRFSGCDEGTSSVCAAHRGRSAPTPAPQIGVRGERRSGGPEVTSDGLTTSREPFAQPDVGEAGVTLPGQVREHARVDGVALDVGSISCWRCRRAAVAFFARGLSVPEPVVPDLREESIYAFASQ